MYSWRLVVFVALAVLAPFPASTQDFVPKSEVMIFENDASWLGIGEYSFRVFVDDQVGDGCWKYPDATKNALELELKRSGIGVAGTDAPYLHTAKAISVGYKTKSGLCVVSYRLEVTGSGSDFFVRDGHRITSFVTRQIWNSSGVMTGPDSDMSSRIKESYVNAIQSFLNTIESKKMSVIEEVLELSSRTDVPPVFAPLNPQAASVFWREYSSSNK